MRVAVVGGGIAGLTAALDLAAAGAEVVVLEGSDRVGGKLRLAEVGGVLVDVGAEALLARRPEAVDLLTEVGLADRLTHPASTSAAIWTRDALRPLPPTVLGVPSDLDALAASGIVDPLPAARAVPVPDHDVSVSEFLVPRVGHEVVDRLVEPLLGGVYAGHASRLSLRAAAPQILALGDDPLTAAAAARSTPTPSGPVFAGLVGGIGALPAHLTEVGGFEVRTSTTVRAARRTAGAWEVAVGPTSAIETLAFDAVVVATPAPAAARLLADVAPAAAFALAGVDVASMAIVTVVLAEPLDVEGSGFLVPPVDGTTIKGATFSSQKWPWLAEAAEGRAVLRASVGRAGETAVLHQGDDAVVSAALADLRAAVGTLPDVVDTHVQRWGGALPQYDVGHLDLVAGVDAAIAEVPGLEVCGATYRGVGVPAVVGSAREAAARLLGSVGAGTDGRGTMAP